MKEIGGFFELECPFRSELHSSAIKLNTGRNCLEYILRVNNYKKIYLPYYICDVVFEPIRNLCIQHEFYHVDESLDPIFNKKLSGDEALLYVDYFGVKRKVIELLSERYDNLIIDNTQAFYSNPIQNVDTFYSARKFFGVPDGAYLYSNKVLDDPISQDCSYERFDHLTKRLDCSAKDAYSLFRKNSSLLKNQPIRRMSNLTEKLLQSIDYASAKLDRERNFLYLHDFFKTENKLDVDCANINAPMVYPLFIKKDGLRQDFINHKIFVATYWPNVLDNTNISSLEKDIVSCVLPIPIDQRYCTEDMNFIIKSYKEFSCGY
ncbi:hypothetical protein [Desulfogranum mediterraneum]|uniref:hypothetical protein n=1 Tax=Desulfogranum mediterraneum TaxID=160661 RepID=UPI000418B77F|nr:hypothetical protein [Desulfogranum mediterraneum]